MPPPPAEPFASRIFLGPALRAQPDRRLVKLVREGYEAAFEEIVRRYRRPLDRFAAAIVAGRSEDVTQDAFSKALLALRGTTTEIELKPWLYRIVRNTALNELRDGPPATEELGEATPGGRSAAEVAEGREEIGELMRRLRALPEPQRAAIVMRELEGLSHEEIAAALGVSGGAARQAIYRGRMALRDGFGLLIPLPLLRVLFDHGAEAAAGAGGVAAAGVASGAGGGAGTALGGLGAGAALKVGVATAVLAGSIGAGVAMQHDRGGHGGPTQAEAAATRATGGRASDEFVSFRAPDKPGRAPLIEPAKGRGRGGPGSGDDHGTDDSNGHHGDGGGRSGHGGEIADDFDDHGGGPGPSGSSGHGGRGSGRDGHSGSDGGSEDHSGEGISGGSQSGRHGSGGEGSGGGSGGSGHSGGSGSPGSSGSNDNSGGSGSGGSGGSGSGDDPVAPAASPTPEPAPPSAESGGESPGGSSGSGGGSGASGVSGSGGSGGSDDS
jgi:RNA polymerase sigma factor (sigma-70 family)